MKLLELPADQPKRAILDTVENSLINPLHLEVAEIDVQRPWGGFYRFANNAALDFGQRFFPGYKGIDYQSQAGISPKILVVAPGKQLSLQKHARRSELWKVLQGTVEVALSDQDEQGEWVKKQVDDIVTIGCGMTHRARALEGWALIAELWVHQDPSNPSDEADITRLQDSYSR